MLDYLINEDGTSIAYWLILPIISMFSIGIISGTAMLFAMMWPKIDTNTQTFTWKLISNSMINYYISVFIASLMFSISYYNNNIIFEEPSIVFCDPSKIIRILIEPIFLTIFINDLQMYIFHRMVHSKHVWLHKQHHEYTQPCSIYHNIYQDYLEGLILSTTSLWPIAYVPVTIYGLLIYLFYIAFFVQLNHSGRKVFIPFVYHWLYHYVHHQKYVYNFCEYTYLWDWIFGTLCMELPSSPNQEVSHKPKSLQNILPWYYLSSDKPRYKSN